MVLDTLTLASLLPPDLRADVARALRLENATRDDAITEDAMVLQVIRDGLKRYRADHAQCDALRGSMGTLLRLAAYEAVDRMVARGERPSATP